MTLLFLEPTIYPPGGWQFTQPELGWSAPSPISEGLNMLVGRVVALRQNNPRFNLPTDPRLVSLEVQAFNCQRLRNSYPDRQFCRGWDEPKLSPSPAGDVVIEVRRRAAVGGCCGG